MSQPRFIAIVQAFSTRLELIEQANGYWTDIGANAQMLLGLGVSDIRSQPGGTIVIEAAREVGFDADGAQRQGVTPLEQRPSRDVTVSVAQPISDRDQWLPESERIAADLRKAIFSNGPDWQVLGVTRIEQSGQDSGWPEPGSSTLIVQITFRVTYIEK